MTHRVAVSVVIPFFNRSDTIKRALESVVAQSHTDWECLVVDDGSTEKERSNLIRIVDELGDQRVCLAHLKENKGGGAARNFGIEMASGKFIAFLDSDDEWMKDKLLIQTAEAEANPGYLWSCQSLVFHGSGDGVLPQNLSIASTVADYLFVRNGWLPTPSFFIHREDLKDIRFDESLPRHQDYDLLLQLEQVGIRPRIVPQVLVKVHWEDLASSGRTNNIETSIQFMKDRKSQFTRTSASCFRVKFIALNRIRNKQHWLGLKEIISAGPYFLINRHLFAETFSFLLFGDNRILRWMAKLRA